MNFSTALTNLGFAEKFKYSSFDLSNVCLVSILLPRVYEEYPPRYCKVKYKPTDVYTHTDTYIFRSVEPSQGSAVPTGELLIWEVGAHSG